MKLLTLSLLIVFFFSCNSKVEENSQNEPDQFSIETVVPEVQSILDSIQLDGSILIYDAQQDKYYSNDFEWAKTGHLPASTFKIPNSIIALETGIVENDSTLFEWDGEPRRLPVWEQDLTLRDAFHFSCVPCYQQVARSIGYKRMNEYLNKFNYGIMEVDSINIDMFWLEGNSQISQLEQIDFLQRFYTSALPISEQTELIMKSLMVIDTNETYSISGKTGWSIRGGNNNGWFVGYIEKNSKVYFFATNISPKEEFDMNKFGMTRQDVTLKALKVIGVI